jgi:fructose-1,6-bisphosphatase II / sedoheptulose-1,7-bisphosphatase
MTQQPETDASQIDRYLTLELARASERAAVAAAKLRGRGDEMAADLAAAEAMREELSRLPVRGRIVIGDGDPDAAPMLYVGEEIGAGVGPRVDLGVAALEGSTLCAKDMPGSISVVAMAPAGSLLHAPDVYMDKIAIGPGYPEGTVDLDRDPGDNVRALAIAKGVRPNEITVSILDRPRHAEIIKKCRKAGACVRLITDGDVAAIILTTHPSETGVDMYLGRGGASEGVLAASVLRCAGASAAAEMGAPRTIMDFMRRLEASPRIAGKKPATQVRAAGKTTEHARRCDGGALLLPAGHADAALPSCQ